VTREILKLKQEVYNPLEWKSPSRVGVKSGALNYLQEDDEFGTKKKRMSSR